MRQEPLATEGGGTEPAADDLDSPFLVMRADLVRLASGLTRSREDAEDVVQEVWFRWRRHRGSVTSASRWLRTVTRNVAVDRFRSSHSGHETACDTALLPEPPSAAASIPGVEVEAELRPALHRILSSLSTLECAVFVLHCGLDWSYADIGRLLDRSEPAIRQLQHRATQHLAAGVQRFDIEPTLAATVTASFVKVSAGSDLFTMLEVLAPGLASRTPVLRSQGRRVVHDVAGIVLFRDERLLLCRRRKELSWFPEVWDLPGRHLRHGEPAIACAVRAARQELDVRVTNPRELSEHDGDDFRLTLFKGVDWTGRPRNVSHAKHDQIGLFTRDEAARLRLADRRLLTLFDDSLAA